MLVIQALSIDLKHSEASLSMISMDLLRLQVGQMSRSPDLAMFVLIDRQNQLLYPLRMRAG